MATSTRRIGGFALAAVLGVSLLVGCAVDRVSSPDAKSTGPSKDLLGGLTSTVTGVVTGLVQANGLLRSQPLAAPITVSQTIGSNGGTLSIPAAGVTVTVPSGALASNTVITMTARAGSMVAYDFAPHGITFKKPLVFSQKLSGTNATLLGAPFLKLGYYSDPSLLGQTTALVSEVLNGALNLLSWSFTSKIEHFSGYIVMCGRSEE